MYEVRLISAITAFDPRGRWFQANHPTRAPRTDIFDSRWSQSEGMMIGFLFGLYDEQFGIDLEVPSEVLDWLKERNAERPEDDPRFELSDRFWLGASRVVRMFQTLDDKNSETIASVFSARYRGSVAHDVNDKTFKIAVDLSGPSAVALAQMAKRFTYEDACRLSTGFDGGTERDNMIEAVIGLQAALRARGFAPR